MIDWSAIICHMNKTPNPLPSTVVNFGPEIGFSLTYRGAQNVANITTHSYGPYTDKETGKPKRHKEHYVDINSLDGRIIHRSNVITNNKILRRVHRAATRKLGVFLLTGRIA